MGSRSIILPSPELVSAGSGTDFRVLRRHRMTAALLLIAFALQPLGLSAEPAVPLSHFAPKPSASNPFLWVSPRPTTPFLAPRPADGGWVEAWEQTHRRTPAFAIKQAPTENWQPAPFDENAPLTPPDGMPTVMPGPLPGIDNVAGNCVITGEVSDATSLNPVAGAFVDVAGSGRTAETDAKGRFTIGGLPAGTFTLEATKLGYFTESSVITTLDGQPAEARFGLRLKPADDTADETLLEEETVVGEYQGESQGNFNLALETSASVTSGISKEEFTKTGVSDAAGAVGKIAGANIVGGKFAVVRGLADRYVTTLFNGASISSADPSRKAVQLDIFPTTAIQGIKINKTYIPSLPGDFGGGTIQINSLNIPSERFAEFKYKIGWNSNLDDRMLVHPDRKIGFWGDVDNPIPDSYLWQLDAQGNPEEFASGGNRVTPGNNNRNPNQQQAQVNEGLRQQALANQLLPGINALNDSQGFMPKEVKPEAPQSFSLVYGDRFQWDNGLEAGFVGAFQHATSDEVNAAGEENRLTSPARSWTEESFAREVDWSLYLSGGIRAGDKHAINATYFKKHIVTDEITHGTDFTIENDGIYGAFANNQAVVDRYGASATYKKEFWTIDPIIRDTEIAQLGGSHKNDYGTGLTWSLTKSTALESRPHTTTFQNGILDFTDPLVAAEAAANPDFIYNPTLGSISTIQYQTFVNDGNGSQDSIRETQRIEEDSREGSLGISQSIYFTEEKEDGPRLEFSFGGSSLSKEREQQGRIYLLKTASWERWLGRTPPSWWPADGSIAPFAPRLPLDGTALLDGSPLPSGYGSLGEYLARNPSALNDYFNGYNIETTGRVPGTGTGSTSANYVQPDSPYYANGSGLEVRNVDSELTLTGLYASTVFHADFWRFGGGVRWEEESKSYEVAAFPLTSLNANDPSRFGEVVTNAMIPSVLAGIDIVPEKSWTNFAWSRTVARPTFFEYLPIESIDQESGIIRRGNPNLTETQIENFDISYNHVFSDTLNANVSFFHKNLADPIVAVQRVDLGTNSITYVNGDRGSISGLEIEGHWKSDWPISLNGNYSFIDSSLEYEVNQGINVTPLDTQFPYQPSQILNLTLGWEPVESPWSAFLTAKFAAEYPTVLRSSPADYDVWLKPRLTLDLIVARKFDFDNFMGTLTLGVKNLARSDFEYEYRGGTPGGNGGPNEGLVYSVEDPGMSYYMEFKAAF